MSDPDYAEALRLIRKHKQPGDTIGKMFMRVAKALEAVETRLVPDWEDVEQLTNVARWCDACQTHHWSGQCNPDVDEQRFTR